MRQLLSVPPILLAAACAGQAPPRAAPAPAAAAVASLDEITGAWDIASFDGHSPVRPDSEVNRRAFVEIGKPFLRFSIDCNYFTLPVRIEAGVLLRAPGLSQETQMGCDSEREARDRTLFAFLGSRPQVALLPDGRVRMTARGHDLLLERPSVRTVTEAQARPIVAKDSLQGRWTITAVNGRQANGLWLELGGEGLGTMTRTERGVFATSPPPPTRAYLGCNALGLNGWARNGDKLTLGFELAHMTERGCDTSTMALETQAFAVLREAMTMELVSPGRLQLINGKGTLDLVREKTEA